MSGVCFFSMYISSVSCKWKNGQAMKFGVQVLQKAPKNQTPAQGVSLVFGMREPVFLGLFVGFLAGKVDLLGHFVMTVTILECLCHHVVTLGLG